MCSRASPSGFTPAVQAASEILACHPERFNHAKWGIHFTQVTPIFCGLGSRDFGVPIGNDRAIRGWVNGHSLLHQPVEELAAAA